MASRGRRAAALAGIVLVTLVLLAGVQWRPLVRGWHTRELRKHPELLREYMLAPGGSLRAEALGSYLETDHGGCALLDLLFTGEDMHALRAHAAASPDVSVRILPIPDGKGRAFLEMAGEGRLSRLLLGAETLGVWNHMPALLGRTLVPGSAPWWRVSAVREEDLLVLHLTPARGASESFGMPPTREGTARADPGDH